jgi:hypothetical protein
MELWEEIFFLCGGDVNVHNLFKYSLSVFCVQVIIVNTREMREETDIFQSF